MAGTWSSRPLRLRARMQRRYVPALTITERAENFRVQSTDEKDSGSTFPRRTRISSAHANWPNFVAG